MPRKIKRKSKGGRQQRPTCAYAINPVADVAASRALRHVALVLRPLAGLVDCGEHVREPERSVCEMLARYYRAAESLAFGMDMAVGHGAWTGAFALGRPIFEYMVRAHYCEQHPVYARWLAHVEYLHNKIRFEGVLLSPKDQRRLGDEQRRQERCLGDYSPRAMELRGETPFYRITFAEMMDEVLGNDDAPAYRLQSMLMHGDPYALEYLAEANVETANRGLVDAAMHMISLGLLLQRHVQAPPILASEFCSAVEAVNALSLRYYEADISEVAPAIGL